jgi:hypothetical protein
MTPKQTRFVAEYLANGLNATKAAIPAEKIAQRIAEGLDAIEVRTATFEGKITDEKEYISWSERGRYTELAARLYGFDDELGTSGEHVYAETVRAKFIARLMGSAR